MNSMSIADSTTHFPANPSDVQELVRTLPKVLPHGSQTKAPLLASATGEVALLDIRGLAGIIEYEPGEYTFTAYAGTRLADIAAALSEHGQYMPFDPPLVETGATLGGTIAAGISGSGRYRYGGLRDFILGVHLVDGQGRLFRGGGKVVKNAAGFDIPKLMVGSMGRLGILISASFKVFPAPPATATLSVTLPSLANALDALARLTGGPYDLEALDLLPLDGGAVTLLARIGGPGDVLDARLERLRSLVGSGEKVMEDSPLWAAAREFAWVPGDHLLVKVASTPEKLLALDETLHAEHAVRRYALGGNLVWFAWPGDGESCHQFLQQQGIRGLVVRGDSARALIGPSMQNTFLDRVRLALDPSRRFVAFE
jgi:glycolate oxidase FAD binding subunit